MASCLIISWQIEGKKVEAVTDFLFLCSKISGDGDCSQEIGRHLLLRRKAMTNPDTILKIKDITLLPKVHVVKAMVFPIVTYGCETWAVRKAELRRIDAFELCVGEDSRRIPWTAGRFSLSILKEVSPEYSLERLMLKLKLNILAT